MPCERMRERSHTAEGEGIMVQEIDVQVQEACSRDTGVSVSRRGENERERERRRRKREYGSRGHQPKNPVWACGHVKITKKKYMVLLLHDNDKKVLVLCASSRDFALYRESSVLLCCSQVTPRIRSLSESKIEKKGTRNTQPPPRRDAQCAKKSAAMPHE